jgi:hypothetical protein
MYLLTLEAPIKRYAATSTMIAKVEQDFLIPATCTPPKLIVFSARLQLHRSVLDNNISKIVNDIVKNLELGHVANTLIRGGPLMSGGISGGCTRPVDQPQVDT